MTVATVAAMPSTGSTVHQLKINLQGAKPPLWRRVQVPSGASLGCLHDVIQAAFGWEDAHLHAFEDSSGRQYGRSRRRGARAP